MRFVVVRRLSTRGEGLGNEFIGWAKGFIASQVLDAKLIGPSWGLNRRKYYRNFETSRFDFLAEELLSRLPHYEFSEDDYRQIGAIDFGYSIKEWARRNGLLKRKSFILTVGGMYGGYAAIAQARTFLWAKLLTSRDALKNIFDVTSQLKRNALFVAVHMRLGGDFTDTARTGDLRGKFNVRLPTAWYLNACEALHQVFGDQIHFQIFTDRRGPEFEEIVRRFNPNQKPQSGLTECSDLALMAMADLRICSVSSYSLVSSFLACGPYLWYEPQLQFKDGKYSLWGHEAAQEIAGSATRQASAKIESLDPNEVSTGMFKGWPISHDGILPLGLVSDLDRIRNSKEVAGNLLEYGAVPAWALKS